MAGDNSASLDFVSSFVSSFSLKSANFCINRKQIAETKNRETLAESRFPGIYGLRPVVETTGLEPATLYTSSKCSPS